MDFKGNFSVKTLLNKAYYPTRRGKKRSVAQQNQVLRMWEHFLTRPGNGNVETLLNRSR